MPALPMHAQRDDDLIGGPSGSGEGGMSDHGIGVPYRARVRFAECDAWGELQLFALHALFDAAVEHAFAQLGVDWRGITHPAQVLRGAGLCMNVAKAPGCDDEIDFEVTGVRIGQAGLEIDVAARQARGGPELATAVLSFVRRQADDGAGLLPAEVSAALSRLATTPAM